MATKGDWEGDGWHEGDWWGSCNTCHPDGVAFGQYEWIEGGTCAEGHDDCVALPRTAFCLECDDFVHLTPDGACRQGHPRDLIHHHEPAPIDEWPHPAQEYFDDAAPDSPVYTVWHPWTYMYYPAEDVLSGRVATYAYRTIDGRWASASGHWGKTFRRHPESADELPEWMAPMLADQRRPSRKLLGFGKQAPASGAVPPQGTHEVSSRPVIAIAVASLITTGIARAILSMVLHEASWLWAVLIGAAAAGVLYLATGPETKPDARD